MRTPIRAPAPQAAALAVAALAAAIPSLAQEAPPAQQITITGTRERVLLTLAPASIGVVSEADIKRTGPMHPQQLLGQVPGVAVAVTNGEGHTTAIRQPFTTGPLYLYLEDGIPTRATGFFNHNALYEVNIPAAGRVEVVRGPGTALYGSDAIGGTVNVLTRAPVAAAGLGASIEAGSFGWRRLLADLNTGVADSGIGSDSALRAAANLSRSDGWRDGTRYDRRSLNLRWDTGFDGGPRFKTLLGATHIHQQTGANTPLPWDAYRNDPTRNLMRIAFREVDALRISTQYEREQGGSLLALTPYLRSNRMLLNGSYNLSSDPRIEDTDVRSLGLMAKWRHDFGGSLAPRLIAGIDLDRSDGTRAEDSLDLQRSGSGALTDYTGYSVGSRIYDYETALRSSSAYLHAELTPLQPLRVTVGLRWDRLDYTMHNRIDAAATRAGSRVYAQMPHARVRYEQLSPKLGATWQLSERNSVYASYNHGFRTPSESQLFRAGSASTAADAASRAELALGLKPIKARQFELGLRGNADGWRYEAVAYTLVKRDDLVSQRDLASNVSTSVNAGRTRHRGFELGLGKAFTPAWRADLAFSRASHRYAQWVTGSGDFSGKAMESAPRELVDTRLTWTPRAGSSLQLEWVRVGSYWLEAGNSPAFGRYPGHDVFNLRLAQQLAPGVSAFARLLNLADRRYADSASVSSSTAVYAPALPRALYAGLEASW